MKALINIADWYASPSNTFIQMYNVEKPPHVLPMFAMDKLVMQEVSYHISAGMSTRLHRKKKDPWSTLSLWIGLYEIHHLKHVGVEIEEIKKCHFHIQSFNLYELHCIVKNTT